MNLEKSMDKFCKRVLRGNTVKVLDEVITPMFNPYLLPFIQNDSLQSEESDKEVKGKA